ncbi:MAG: hypothetical protein E7639_06145 [Ruminococcaceae bacterium]|nr:hypothetical protein [Oscillospiraceae bacterium]
MKINLKSNGFLKHAELFQKAVCDRITAEFTKGGMAVELQIDKTIPDKESFLIRGEGESWTVIGSDELGLYFGIGKFLHTAKWDEYSFIPKATNGVVAPDCRFRAMYFATHFYNFYHAGTAQALKEYVDDMLLWGYNTILGIIPVITLNEEDPNFSLEVDRVKRIFNAAKERGMRTGILICANQGFMDAPAELSSELPDDLSFRGDLGRNICISKPGGLSYMRRVWQKMLQAFKQEGLEYIVTWPYDEGGCGCKDCRPWGARGYLNACIELRKEALSLYPNASFIVSTWAFDVPENEGEYEGLYQRLTGDMSWVDFLMVDAHREYPRYPLEHKLIKPIVNFPEISMWALSPWGGYGANPLPERFQRIWNESKHILDGGLPYSEGIYEDISKIQFAGYYWCKERPWTDILAEYINYECSSDATVITDALELMRSIEINHTRCARPNLLQPQMDVAEKAKELAEKIDSKLSDKRKNSWRWRILYMRAILDYKRYKAYMACPESADTPIASMAYGSDLLVCDEQAQNFFRELIKYYHCVPPNGKNTWTYPPLGGSSARSKTLVPDRRDQAKKSGKNAVKENEG